MHGFPIAGTEANHCAGTLLKPSVTVVSNTVANNVRTVVLSRAFAGLTKDHYSFGTADATLNYISAIGASAGAQAFAYHGVNGHDSLTMSFMAKGACTINRPCAQQYVGKSQSCMVISGRLIPHRWRRDLRLQRGRVGRSLLEPRRRERHLCLRLSRVRQRLR